MTEFCLQFDSPVVPDPYYGGSQGFEEVLNLVEDACEGLLRHVQRQLQDQLQAQVPPVQH
jgi:protein-tyrosine phosphatase